MEMKVEIKQAARTKRLKFGLWSGSYAEVTGQAVITAHVASILAGEGVEEFVYRGSGWAMIASWIKAWFRLWWQVLRGDIRQLYVVCSRSTGGFIRDCPAYAVSVVGVRVVVHVHGSDVIDLLDRKIVGRVASWALRAAHLIIPSQHLMGPLRDRGVKLISICENFSEFFEDRERHPRKHDSHLVVWNSNVMASKGFFIVAMAVERLYLKYQRFHLVAVGRPLGDEEMDQKRCESELDALRGRPWFAHLGTVDRKTSAQILFAAKSVCLPSTYRCECQPLSLIEAMCAGTDIVIANTPALRATVEDYPCEIVASPSVDAVVLALERIDNQGDLGMRHAEARQRVRTRFSRARFDTRMRELLWPEAESK